MAWMPPISGETRCVSASMSPPKASSPRIRAVRPVYGRLSLSTQLFRVVSQVATALMRSFELNMRPLNREDYVLIAIVVLTALVGICALAVSITRIVQDSRRARETVDPADPSVPRHRFVRKIAHHR